ncbi:thioesterase domain-containing protein [Bradyrhizobium sp. NAS80.1]|uniref:thioesterase domain-containing protein n=1 Tax=Bradyrhizobium sp. NAS80.1 TaxID=1680159 RepID=UPI0009FF2638|nr:thioesterase domain-containing protein [Bradyrhizobium sp. NAS80.1]
MMDATVLLSTLRARDVRLWIEDTQLKCSAPVGALDAGLRQALSSRKQEIMALLQQAEALKNGPASIVPIKPEGCRPPIFAVSGHGGDVFCLLQLARHLHVEQPMIGVQPPGLDGSEPLKSIEALARYEIEQIRRYRPHGPYLIAGHCAGGTLAFEVARQLVGAGQEVPLLALIGSPFPTMFGRASMMWVRVSGYAKALTPSAFKRKLELRLERQRAEAAMVGSSTLSARQRVENATVAAVRSYKPRPYPGQIDLFVTADTWHRSHLWSKFCETPREHHLEDFAVNDLLLGPNVSILAAALQGSLNQLQRAGATALA